MIYIIFHDYIFFYEEIFTWCGNNIFLNKITYFTFCMQMYTYLTRKLVIHDDINII